VGGYGQVLWHGFATHELAGRNTAWVSEWKTKYRY
jgi:hypothetical protein